MNLILAGLLAMSLLTSCGGRQAGYEIVKPEIDKSRSEDEEARKIASYPTVLPVSPDELFVKWERARLFAETFLGTSATYSFQNRQGAVPSTSLIMHSENYSYSVRKEQGGSKYLLTVLCQPSTPAGKAAPADLNARNLARFINEGRLEGALLVK